jgi:hypothetical protein
VVLVQSAVLQVLVQDWRGTQLWPRDTQMVKIVPGGGQTLVPDTTKEPLFAMDLRGD